MLRRYIVILAAVLMLMGCAGQEKEEPAEDLVINIPKRCKVGSIQTETGKELYRGVIEIINDGKNGKQIEIIIE